MIIENALTLNAIYQLPNSQSTGAGWIQEGTRVLLIVASGALAHAGTSTATPTQALDIPSPFEFTASSPAHLYQPSTAAPSDIQRTIVDLRRLSGLTWEQLADLFEVSRRSVHFWASGKPSSVVNEQRVKDVLDVVRVADRGDAASTRAALLRVTGQTSPFELLSAQKFDDARKLLGRGPGRREVKLTELSTAAKAARTPRNPDELVDARQDPVPRKSRRARGGQTVRNPRGSS